MAHVDGVDFYVCPTGDAGDRDVQFTTDLDVEFCSVLVDVEFLDSFPFW